MGLIRLCATIAGFKDRVHYISTAAYRASFFLVMVLQRRGPKMRPHHVQQPKNTLNCLLKV